MEISTRHGLADPDTARIMPTRHEHANTALTSTPNAGNTDTANTGNSAQANMNIGLRSSEEGAAQSTSTVGRYDPDNT